MMRKTRAGAAPLSTALRRERQHTDRGAAFATAVKKKAVGTPAPAGHLESQAAAAPKAPVQRTAAIRSAPRNSRSGKRRPNVRINNESRISPSRFMF